MTAKEILIKAKGLIDTPDKWVRGTYAEDKSGNACIPNGLASVTFSATGALFHAGSDARSGPGEPYFQARKLLGEVLPFDHNQPYPGANIKLFNDHHDTTHADVMGAFDEAIRRT